MDARSHRQRAAQTWIEWAQARPIVAAAAVIAIGGAATILGAWFFQYLGYRPCPLCLEQRHPYYFAIPLAVFILLGELVGSRRRILLAALAVIVGLMLWNAGLGSYHAGRRMEVVAGAEHLRRRGRPRRSRQSAEAVAIDQCRALRRSGVAVPRPLARRLQRADLAGACRRGGLGLPRRPQAAAANGKRSFAYGSSSVSQ